MFSEKIPAKQLTAWIFAATIPALIQLWGGASWLLAALAGAVCAVAVWAVWRWGGRLGRWLCALELLYVIIIIGSLLPWAGKIWPGGDQYPAVPLIVLALAAWSAQKGPSAAARVGSVLFWVVLLMYLAVFGAGVRSVEWEWMAPTGGELCWLGVTLMLVPAGACILKREDAAWKPRLILPAIFTAVACALCCGILSPAMAGGMEDAFFETSRSLEIFGVARRFEAVISAAMTVGWFALLSLLLSLGAQYARALLGKGEKGGVWGVSILSALWMLCELHISGLILAALASIFWVLLPLGTQVIGAEKKS